MAAAANRLTDYGPLTDRHPMSGELAALVGRAVADPVLVAGGADAAGPVEIHPQAVRRARTTPCLPAAPRGLRHADRPATRPAPPARAPPEARLATVARRLRKGRLSAGDAAATVADPGAAARER